MGWKHKKHCAKLVFNTGDFVKTSNSCAKEVEDFTVGELRDSFDKLKGRLCQKPVWDYPVYVDEPKLLGKKWFDVGEGELNSCDEDGAQAG